MELLHATSKGLFMTPILLFEKICLSALPIQPSLLIVEQDRQIVEICYFSATYNVPRGCCPGGKSSLQTAASSMVNFFFFSFPYVMPYEEFASSNRLPTITDDGIKHWVAILNREYRPTRSAISS